MVMLEKFILWICVPAPQKRIAAHELLIISISFTTMLPSMFESWAQNQTAPSQDELSCAADQHLSTVLRSNVVVPPRATEPKRLLACNPAPSHIVSEMTLSVPLLSLPP